MSQSIKNVLIIGAGGNVGKAAVDALLKAGDFTITALSRESSSSKLPSTVKVITIADDYPQDKLIAAFKGQDGVVNTILPLDPGLQNRIADAAAEAGVKRFIPTGYGSDITAPKVTPTVPLYLGLAAMHGYVKSKESTGLTWTALVNGGFFDWGLDNGFLGFDLQNKVATIYDKGDKPLNVSTLAFVGETIAAIFTHPAETANKYVYVQETKGTQLEILATLEKITGAKWTTTNKNAAEANKSGSEKMIKGDHSGIADMIMGVMYGEEPTTDYEVHHGLDNDILGLKQVPIADLVAKIVKG